MRCGDADQPVRSPHDRRTRDQWADDHCCYRAPGDQRGCGTGHRALARDDRRSGGPLLRACATSTAYHRPYDQSMGRHRPVATACPQPIPTPSHPVKQTREVVSCDRRRRSSVLARRDVPTHARAGPPELPGPGHVPDPADHRGSTLRGHLHRGRHQPRDSRLGRLPVRPRGRHCGRRIRPSTTTVHQSCHRCWTPGNRCRSGDPVDRPGLLHPCRLVARLPATPGRRCFATRIPARSPRGPDRRRACRRVDPTSTPRNDDDPPDLIPPGCRYPYGPTSGAPRLVQQCSPAQPWQRGPLLGCRTQGAGGSLLCCRWYSSMEP